MAEPKFYKVTSTKPVIEYIAGVIKRHLANNESVLWLLSGGSAIDIEIEVAKKLNNNDDKLKNLTVTLIDERYGLPGHRDSNWKQIMGAGFQIDGAKLIPVLNGLGFAETSIKYEEFISRSFKKNTYRIGLVGIGADGHTLGIKGLSPATNAEGLVSHYKWYDYERLTLTPKAIPMLDEVVAYVVGKIKNRLLDDLDKPISAAKFPGKYLLRAHKLSIYNDYKGEVLK